jgi:diguanylate cyclase (GGDEF)-like protein
MNQMLARARGSSAGFAILYLDIDSFKGINDTHGHEFGDLLLKEVAQRLVKVVRQGDTVARVGGDEFVIVLDMVNYMRIAGTVAQHVSAALSKPMTIQRHRIAITASIGISLYPDNGGDADTLFKSADYAMYLAKREGGNRHVMCPVGEPLPGMVLARR